MSGPGVRGRPLRLPAGAILFRPGDACPGYPRIRSGGIAVRLVHAGGREVLLYRVGPGEVCLQTFACLTQGRAYTAEAVVEAALEADLVPAHAFAAAMDDPDFRAEVFGSVARRFGEMERLVERFAFEGLDARLALALLARGGGDGEVRDTHDALAAECGSAREAVSRKLKQFSARGLVETGRGRIRLLDPDGLRRLVAAGEPSPP